MTTGRALRFYGGNKGIECQIPQSFFSFLSSGPHSLQIGTTSQSFVVKGISALENGKQIFKGKFYLYETKDAIKVLNHEQFEDEEAALKDTQSETIRKIRLVIFPLNKLILFDMSVGFKQIIEYFNALLPSYFLSYPQEKANIDTILYESITNYESPTDFLFRTKRELKNVQFQMPCTNLAPEDSSLIGGIKSKEGVIVTVTFSSAKRGESLPEAVPEELVELIQTVGGDSKFKAISAKEQGGSNKILMSSVASFEIQSEQDHDLYKELIEHGVELLETFGDTLQAGYHG